MDGNGRWAAQRQLPREAGHRRGVANIQRVVRALAERGVAVATLYAFSTENWRRPTTEVDALMSILAEEIEPQTRELGRAGRPPRPPRRPQPRWTPPCRTPSPRPNKPPAPMTVSP